MNYGFISRKNEETIKKHIEALKLYNLEEIVLDDFSGELDNLFKKLKAGDSLYIAEPPRDIIKLVAIYSFTRKHDVKLYVNGEVVGDIPQLDLFDAYVKQELAKRMHRVN